MRENVPRMTKDHVKSVMMVRALLPTVPAVPVVTKDGVKFVIKEAVML